MVQGTILSQIKAFVFLSQGIAGKSGPRGQRGPTVGNSAVCANAAWAIHINYLFCSNENLFLCVVVYWLYFLFLLKAICAGWGVVERGRGTRHRLPVLYAIIFCFGFYCFGIFSNIEQNTENYLFHFSYAYHLFILLLLHCFIPYTVYLGSTWWAWCKRTNRKTRCKGENKGHFLD